MPDKKKVIERIHEAIDTGVCVDLFMDILNLLRELDNCENCAIATEDRQLVVRCSDCKHATMTSDGKMCKYCGMDTDDFGYPRCVYHDADWFCADGVKRNG